MRFWNQEDAEPTFVYVVACGRALKVGISGDVERRLEGLQSANPKPLQLLKSVRISNRRRALVIERSIHDHLHRQRLSGEWFRRRPEDPLSVVDLYCRVEAEMTDEWIEARANDPVARIIGEAMNAIL